MNLVDYHIHLSPGIMVQNPCLTAHIVMAVDLSHYNSKYLVDRQRALEAKYVKRVATFNKTVRILTILTILLGAITVGALELYAIIWLANAGVLSQYSGSMCGFILAGSCFITGLFIDEALSHKFTVDHYSIIYRRK